jgi:ribosomal protein L37AE/L43A
MLGGTNMEFTILATGVKTAISLAKSITEVVNDDKLKAKSIELYDTIISLQRGILSLQSEYHSLLQDKHGLKKKLMEIEGWEKEKMKYELVKIGEGVHVFSLKTEYEPSMPSHYICPKCYHDNKKSILVAEYTSSNESKYTCPKCNNYFVTNTALQDGIFTVDDY